MRAEVAPRGGVHDGLEQAAENRGADAAPVERAGGDQCVPHRAVKTGGRELFGKEFAIDIRECGEVFVEIFEPFILRCVEHIK